MTDLLGDGEWTEAVDADIPRVDLVGRAANGSPGFLLMKHDDTSGLLDPDFVRDLIAKADPQPAAEETVTMTGSPAAIAKMIHQAAQRQTAEPVAKAKYDADDLKRMAANGEAMGDESYPIADRADHDAIRRHILTRAKALGATSTIPDNWNADGSLKGDVTKETDTMDDVLDPMTALAEPDTDAPGMDTDPGSPAWEAVDAATARKWTAILARAKNAIDTLADREMLEAAAGDEDSIDNAWDLQDACCAIDYAISVLAPFAVAEQAEADCCDDMQMVGKTLAGFDTAPLDTIEALDHVRKAGRVLSAGNEAAIRGAVDALQKVLASLPQAPTATEDGQPVAKTANEETNMAAPTLSEDVTAQSGQEPAMGTQQADPKPVAGQVVTDTPMAKADGDKPEMVAIYDKNGNLVGIVAPTDITRIAGAEPAADADDMADEPATDAAPDASDLTPAPAAEVGTPTDAEPDDNLNKTTHPNPTPDTTSETVLKSIAADAVKAGLDAYSATQEQVIAKQAADLAQMAEGLVTLTGLIKALEEQPAVPKVFTNGAVPPRDQMRGQDRSGNNPPIDVAKARELKKGLYAALDAGEQNRIAVDMQSDAIVALQEIHERRAH